MFVDQQWIPIDEPKDRDFKSRPAVGMASWIIYKDSSQCQYPVPMYPHQPMHEMQ